MKNTYAEMIKEEGDARRSNFYKEKISIIYNNERNSALTRNAFEINNSFD
jgi:hypothetical protein